MIFHGQVGPEQVCDGRWLHPGRQLTAPGTDRRTGGKAYQRDSKRSIVQVSCVTVPFLKTAGLCQRVLHCNENPIYVFLFWELCGLSPNLHIHVSVSANRSWEYINHSQAHECGNWDWGRTIHFLGKFVSNFWYCVFAVWPFPLIKRGKAGRNHLNN